MDCLVVEPIVESSFPNAHKESYSSKLVSRHPFKKLCSFVSLLAKYIIASTFTMFA
jgi:hypothetical protein